MGRLTRLLGAAGWLLALVAGTAPLAAQVRIARQPDDRPTAVALERYLADIRRVAPDVRALTSEDGATVERRDAGLQAARARVQAASTAQHHRELAQAYVRAGISDLAFDHYTAALARDKSDAVSLEGLARLWRDWGFADRALSQAHRAVFFAPGSASAHNTLGTILLKRGDAAAAAQEFRRAMTLAPETSSILNNVCYASIVRDSPADAVAACVRAAALEPNDPVVQQNLAAALAAERRRSKGRH